MSTTDPASSTASEPQRKALAESERMATERQPENFKDKSTDDKVVEIGADITDAPIKGIDPDQARTEPVRPAGR